MNQVITIMTIVALLGSGIIAGVFYAFSTFIMQGLKKLADAEGVRAMQWINITVFSPLMMGLFIGAVPFGLLLSGLGIWQWGDSSLWIILGAVFYVIGTFGVTAIGNVPLNEKLKDMDADEKSTQEFWHFYASRWMTWNHVRTVAASVSTLMYAFALLM